MLENIQLISRPSIGAVVQHLHNIAKNYSDDEKGAYKEAVFTIYDFLSQCNHSEVTRWMKEYNVKVWTGKEFVEYHKIILTSTRYDVTPYYYQVPTEVSNLFENALKELGCASQSENCIYIDVLEKIKNKHEASTEHSIPDLELSLNLVKFLAERIGEITDKEKLLINVPVDCNIVKLCKLQECTYHDFDGEVVYSSLSSHNVLHRGLNEEVAQMLGIPDLVSLLLSDDTSSIFESWGQHEPLTLRLNRLLKDYKDGLPIPKELIQNADDAGASEVYFLYDQRENEDLKGCLFDRKMSDWQGPALWVYNNEMFKEEDFRNITKLNAGTKEHDTTKIGKFGLGFNAVYHLTDVPSFLSGDNLVVFDPHAAYLGKALKNDMPGIRIRICKDKKDFVKFNDQFKVFHNIFGVKLDFSCNNVEPFNGTLFRFPLRNAKTAEKSEINNFEYTDYEMKLLLNRFEKSISHLLLFTQNVRVVKVFHLNKHKHEMMEMFSVEKSVEKLSGPDGNIMQVSNNELLKLLMDSSYHIQDMKFLQKITMKGVCSNGTQWNENWLGSSVIGSQESFNWAAKNRGHNPCGGVAIKYKKMFNNQVDLVFEDNHHIFCFLPLPENSNLPVNVNGSFEVSNDRKRLTKRTDDEKKYDVVNDWNDMLGRDIGQAYFNLLVALKDMCPVRDMENWMQILPTLPLPENNSCILELVKSLMNKLLFGKEEMFPVFDESNLLSWHTWGDIIMLAPNLYQCLSKEGICFMNWFFEIENIHKVCVKVPDKFLCLVEKLGFASQLYGSVINEEDFFRNFFKYVDHRDLNIDIRNKIVVNVLDRRPQGGYLKDLLLTRPCIPTLPNDSLKIPSQLVKIGSKAGKLYDLEDEVFPSEGFDKYSSYLEYVGMENHSLRWENILNRAESVTMIDIDNGCQRSQMLVHFIKESDNSCPEDIKSNLLQTPFLIASIKPDNALIAAWYSDGFKFGSPGSMFAAKYLNIASSSCLICEEEFDHQLSQFLTLDRHPSFDVIHKQLKKLVNAYHGKVDIRFTKSLDDIYNYLQQYCDDSHYKQLLQMDMIYTESGKLVKPHQVFVDIDQQELPGYLHKLPSNLREYNTVFFKLGVNKRLTTSMYIDTLKKITDDYVGKALPETLWGPIVRNVVPFLCRKELPIVGPVYLPDNCFKMHNIENMSFKHPVWFPDVLGTIYTHEEISESSCLKLGIKPSLTSYMSKNSIGIRFGQHEALTTRIKNLLRGYSEKEDVLKEILQNADDAGATEVEFVLDMRFHGDIKVFSDKWKKAQGPALLVSNNGTFTKSDLQGIQSLGEGSKSKEPLKTGKYGVGFNAVYRITDCPSFLTQVKDHGDVLCIFDPNLHFLDDATEDFPGIMLDDARRKLDEIFTDVKSAYLVNESQFNFENKTLFRFPLRDEKMAKCSQLMQDVTTTDDVLKMLSQLKKNASSILLFLNHVKSITFTTIKKGLFVEKESFTAKQYGISTGKLADFRVFQQTLAKKLGDAEALANFNKQISYNVCVQNTNIQSTSVTHWNIVEQCGFSDMTNLDASILGLIETDKLCLLPKGAVASLDCRKDCELCQDLICKKKICAVSGYENKSFLLFAYPS